MHLGFDINHGIPRKVFLTDGKGPERPFVSMILSPGQTGVLDRGYQAHDLFDLWQEEGKHFVCRFNSIHKQAENMSNEVYDVSRLGRKFIYYLVHLCMGTEQGAPAKAKAAYDYHAVLNDLNPGLFGHHFIKN